MGVLNVAKKQPGWQRPENFNNVWPASSSSLSAARQSWSPSPPNDPVVVVFLWLLESGGWHPPQSSGWCCQTRVRVPRWGHHPTRKSDCCIRIAPCRTLSEAGPEWQRWAQSEPLWWELHVPLWQQLLRWLLIEGGKQVDNLKLVEWLQGRREACLLLMLHKLLEASLLMALVIALTDEPSNDHLTSISAEIKDAVFLRLEFFNAVDVYFMQLI